MITLLQFVISNDNIMDDFYTARQVQNILKVDRITVYRMLKDGRIKGVKIGQQWRFARRDVEQLISPDLFRNEQPPQEASAGFPTHCVQTIQDLFAEVSLISALVIDMHGSLLTEISRPTRFCEILQSSPSGQNLCRGSMQNIARDGATTNGASGSKFFTCQAGLQYIGAPIFDGGVQIGLFLAGQFYWQPPDPREEAERIRRLAEAHNLPLEALKAAAREIPVIEPAQHARVEAWPFAATRAVQSILHERQCFIERLQQIANLTQLS
jgi:excisionase family DNA binding protein